jgi:hypothetical protein
MAEQVKVFKNVRDVNVPLAATTVDLVTTSSTERAVVIEMLHSGITEGTTLTLDGFVLGTADVNGTITKTTRTVIDTDSTLALNFPELSTNVKMGFLFTNGSDGVIKYTSGDGPLDLTPEQVGAATVIVSLVGAMTGGVISFYGMGTGGTVHIYNESGTETGTLSMAGEQLCVSDTHLYSSNGGTIYYHELSTGNNGTQTISPATHAPAANQGSYLLYHQGIIYSKQRAASTSLLKINTATWATEVVSDTNLHVGDYSDGGCLVTTEAGVPYIVEQGQAYWSSYNLNTGVITRYAQGSSSSTEYGNGAAEIAPGIALIFGEQSDRHVLIDLNVSPPTRSETTGTSEYLIEQAIGNKFALGLINVVRQPRSYSALVSGVHITEDA